VSGATKASLLAAYRARLAASGMAWTVEPGKLDAAMEKTRATLNGAGLVDTTGTYFQAARRDVGLPSRMTLKALHALPDGEGWV